jgi:hypothetical protein
MKKNVRRLTYEESKETIRPYESLPSVPKCKKHTEEISSDNFGRTFKRCLDCWTVLSVINPKGKLNG